MKAAYKAIVTFSVLASSLLLPRDAHAASALSQISAQAQAGSMAELDPEHY